MTDAEAEALDEVAAKVSDNFHIARMGLGAIGSVAFGIWQASWAAGIAATAFALMVCLMQYGPVAIREIVHPKRTS